MTLFKLDPATDYVAVRKKTTRRLHHYSSGKPITWFATARLALVKSNIEF